jgi:predicted benzoate:H+ symporter BenE
MKDRAVYLIVGLLMAFSFFLVRTLPLPYVLVRGCIMVWWEVKEYSFAMKVVQTLLVGTLCGLNSFWSVKIIQGLTKHLFAKKKDLLIRQP